jgi:hypothetical protein
MSSVSDKPTRAENEKRNSPRSSNTSASCGVYICVGNVSHTTRPTLRDKAMSNELNAAPTLAQQLAALAALRAEQRQKAGAVSAAVRPIGRTHDALGGVIGAGTHAMHVVLAEAYAEGVLLTRKEIASLSGYTNTPNHLQTMSLKGRAVSAERGLWRLSDAAGEAWHGRGAAFGFASAARASGAGGDDGDDNAPPADRPQEPTPDDVPPPPAEPTPDDVPPPPAEPMPPPPGDDTAAPKGDTAAPKGKGKKGK